MPSCRQSRGSERVFDDVIKEVRDLDKLLWNGEPHHLQDVEEIVRDLQRDLGMVLKHFRDEMDARQLELLVRSVSPATPEEDQCHAGCQVVGTVTMPESIVSPRLQPPPSYDYHKAREEMLSEIDAVLMSTVFWQGGRLDTIKWLVEHCAKTPPNYDVLLKKTEAERDRAQRDWANAQSTMAHMEEELMGLHCQLDAIQETAQFFPQINVDLKDISKPLDGTVVHLVVHFSDLTGDVIMACGTPPYELRHSTVELESVNCKECLEWMQAGDSCAEFGRIPNCDVGAVCDSRDACYQLWEKHSGEDRAPVKDLPKIQVPWDTPHGPGSSPRKG